MIKQKCFTVSLMADKNLKDREELNKLLDAGWRIVQIVPILAGDSYYHCSYTRSIQYILEIDV